jgi:hypothetical protein
MPAKLTRFTNWLEHHLCLVSYWSNSVGNLPLNASVAVEKTSRSTDTPHPPKKKQVFLAFAG